MTDFMKSIYAKQRRWFPLNHGTATFLVNHCCYKKRDGTVIMDPNELKEAETIYCNKCKQYFTIDNNYSVSFRLEGFKGWIEKHECIPNEYKKNECKFKK